MRVARRLAHVLLIVLTLIVGATAAAIIVAETAWFKNWLRGYIVREANQYLNGELSIARLGGNLFFGVELEDVAVSMDGSQVVAVKDLGVDYSVFELVSKGLSIDRIHLNQPTIYLRREGDTWSIARLVKKQEQEADREGPKKPMSFGEIGISDATVVVDGPVGTSGVSVPSRFDKIDARLSFKYEPVHYSLEISHVSFRTSDPAIGLNAASGKIAIRDDALHFERVAVRTEESSILIDGAVRDYLTNPRLNVKVSSDKLSIPEIARLVPSLQDVPLQPAFEVSAEGPLDHLAVEMNVRSKAGQITGQIVADLNSPKRSIVGDVAVRHVDASKMMPKSGVKSDVTASLRMNLRAADISNFDTLEGTATVNTSGATAAGYRVDRVSATAKIVGGRAIVSGNAAAYGANARLSGRVRLPGPPASGRPVAYDFQGAIAHVDLQKLPASLNAPRADTDVNADIHVKGSGGLSSEKSPEKSSRLHIDAELRFAESSVAGARILSGGTASVSMHGKDLSYTADASVANADLLRIGRAFNIAALADDKYKSSLNGNVKAEGSGSTPKDMNVVASGSLTDSALAGGRITELSFNATLKDDVARVTMDGSFAEFDPAVASGNPKAAGKVSGVLDADATITNVSSGISPESIEGTVTATIGPSKVGGLDLNWGYADAVFDKQTADIHDIELVGPDIHVQASGTVAASETGNSNLTFHADTPRLEEIGKLADVPVSGITTIDGKASGKRGAMAVSGTLVADNVKYGDNGALTMKTNYSAHVANLDYQHATIDADTSATFVSVAGQEVNELTAKTQYADNRVKFDITARQPKRSLVAAGSVAVDPDGREVRLERMTLDAQGVRWQLAPNSKATVRMAGDEMRAEDVRLVSGAQQLSLEGTFGKADSELKATLSDIDLATVDALLLRPPQLSGRLNATATVRGTSEKPAVEGEFQIAQGGFRQFKYETFGGTLKYADRGIGVDARLQQNSSQWMTAKGTLPLALFSTTNPDAPSPGGNAPIDFAIDSSPIDLGLVQGFTTLLTNVTGTAEAHVRIGGTADTPEPSGSIAVQNGTAKVEPTGAVYKNIAGRVDLQPDRVHIDQITVLDNDNDALSITGDLAVREYQLGGVQLYVNSDDFKVVDNKIGNVHLQSSLEIVGDLKSPRVQGYLSIESGRINLDELMALTGTPVYATEQTQYNPTAEAQTTGPLAGVKADIGLSIPNNFIINASDLQAPGAPIGLGALNVTLGGDLHATKEPGDVVRVRGIVNTVRGTYDFEGRRFDIMRDGTIQFEGLDELDPVLNLKAQRVIQAVQAIVNVQGTLNEPNIVLSSTPPLEQADILSLIVFNQPINQVSEGQQMTLVARAQSLATGAVSSELAKSIGNALNLDVFEINVAPENGGGPEVTVGQQLGQNLFVKVEQGIGNLGSTNFILEYELAKWLRFQTNVMQGSSTQQSLFQRAQGTGLDLLFFFSY